MEILNYTKMISAALQPRGLQSFYIEYEHCSTKIKEEKVGVLRKHNVGDLITLLSASLRLFGLASLLITTC